MRLDRRTIEALRRPTGVSGGAPSGRELNFFDVLNIFKRQIWIIILAAIIGMAVAGYYSQTVTPQYLAYSTVYIPQTNSMSILNGVYRTGGTTQNLRGDSIETHALIIRSYEIISKAWRNICEDPEKRKLMVTIDPDSESLTEQRAVSKLTNLIAIRVGGEQRGFHDTNTIAVTCQSESPKEAAMIVNTVVEQYKQHFVERYTKSNEDVKAAIESSKLSIEKEIEVKKQELVDFIQNSPTTFIGSDDHSPLLTALTGMSEKMVDIDFQLLRLENQVASLDNKVGARDVEDMSDAELIELMGGGDSESILTTIAALARGNDYETALRFREVSSSSTVQQQIRDLELKRLNLLQTLAVDHPSVVLLEDQIKELQRQAATIDNETETRGRIGVINYSELFKTYRGALRSRMEELTEEKVKIQAYVDDRDEEVREITQYRETLDTMKVSIESSKTMLEHLDQNLKQLALMSDVNTYQVEVLSAAVENNHPVYPNVLKFVLAGFVLGVALGSLLAYLIDVTDATFHTPAEITRTLHMPILTHLVSFKHRLRDITPKKRKELRDAHKPEPELLAYYKPNDAICEVFRQLRTRLFNQRPGTGCVVVMNTSPHPTDGKTMIISNLAVKVAEAGKRVLLIDCDMRKPDIHKMFGLDNTRGLSNVLLGECTLEEGISEVPIKNLQVMTAGSRTKRSPAELIAGQEFDQMLATLREQYDVILIDTPPVLYVNDAATVAPRTDGVLYVFRIRRRGRPDVVSGVRALA
ncbi:MAG: polysaccharide biosynthesis tyrosine autokinase, partial [Thermoguttaceae bacterium]|nr:polysaccharide biosynthesis tyrosine autokinase [Thermoguttaceae bacterium]